MRARARRTSTTFVHRLPNWPGSCARADTSSCPTTIRRSSVTGGQALFQAADGSLAFVRQYSYLHSEYLDAFAAAGLDVVRCVEPRLGPEEAAGQGMADQFIPEATQAAFAGLPGALVWQLERR